MKTTEQRIYEIINAMTIEEKVSQIYKQPYMFSGSCR